MTAGRHLRGRSGHLGHRWRGGLASDATWRTSRAVAAFASPAPFLFVLGGAHAAIAAVALGALGALAAFAIATSPKGPRPTFRAERRLRAAASGAVITSAAWTWASAGGTAPPSVSRFTLAATCSWAFLALAASTPHGGRAGGEDVALPPACAAFKRVTDLVVAVPLLVVTAPLIAVVAVLVARDSPGGWLFRQVRVGRDGRRFHMYKVRTMVVDNDDSTHREYVAALIAGAGDRRGGMYKLVDDPRVTRVGAVLRRLSLDELPQLVNVIRGDMSLVGPRPPLPSETVLYDSGALERLRVKPGLTGLWQVNGRSRLGFAEMVDLDVRYWREWTPLLELSIVVRTPAALFARQDTA